MDKPKKVLHIFGSLNTGGAETLIMRIYREINRDNIQFDFLVASKEKGFYEEEIIKLGGKIIKIDKPSQSGIIQYIRLLYKILCDNGPYEAVHSHVYLFSGINTMVAKYAHIPKRISHSHTTKVESTNLPLRKIYQFIMKYLILKYSTDLFACSNEAKESLFGERIDNSKYKIIKNGVDLDLFKDSTPDNSDFKKIRNEYNDIMIIGHVGRFVEIKNHQMVLDVFYEIKRRGISSKLILVGEGPLESKIREKVDLLGLSEEVIFLGSRNDVPDILKCLDVLIFPSIIEGFGMVVLEAQCARLPCVVSNTVPKEVDMKANLVSFVSLDSDVNYWADKLLEAVNLRKPSFNYISRIVKSKGYDISEIALKLEDFYLG